MIDMTFQSACELQVYRLRGATRLFIFVNKHAFGLFRAQEVPEQRSKSAGTRCRSFLLQAAARVRLLTDIVGKSSSSAQLLSNKQDRL